MILNNTSKDFYSSIVNDINKSIYTGCHCERSEAISLDCHACVPKLGTSACRHVAPLLAMTTIF